MYIYIYYTCACMCVENSRKLASVKSVKIPSFSTCIYQLSMGATILVAAVWKSPCCGCVWIQSSSGCVSWWWNSQTQSGITCSSTREMLSRRWRSVCLKCSQLLAARSTLYWFTGVTAVVCRRSRLWKRFRPLPVEIY